MRRLAERAVLAIAGHADDFEEWPSWPTYANALAQSLFARPERSGQSLVEYDNVRCAFTIGFCKIAPAQQRRFHRLEIVRAHYVEAGADSFICFPTGTTRCEDLELRKREAELRKPHQARALDARLCFDPSQQIAVEVLAFSFLVAQQPQVDWYGQRVIDAEAWVYRVRALQRTDEQAGADKQYYRQRHLRRYEHCAQARAPRARALRVFALESHDDVQPRSLKRRR